MLVAFMAAQNVLAGSHRLGGGVHYNMSVKGLIESGDFDKSGLSFLLSYQYAVENLPLKLEGNLELYPSSLSPAGKTTIIPQAYLLLGGFLYGGLGIGLPYADGNFGDPIYNLRAGLDFPLSKIHIDLNANYKFVDFDQLSNPDVDNITIGVIGRYEF